MGTEAYTLRNFLADVDRVTVEEQVPEVITERVSVLMAPLLRNSDCIPAEFRRRPAEGHGRYMLHRSERFNVTAIVWGPGDGFEAHSHETWGVVGVLENAIEETRFRLFREGAGWRLEVKDVLLHRAGAVSRLVPPDDIHAMKNSTAQNTVEIHVYGLDLVGLERRKFGSDGAARTYRSPKYLNC